MQKHNMIEKTNYQLPPALDADDDPRIKVPKLKHKDISFSHVRLEIAHFFPSHLVSFNRVEISKAIIYTYIHYQYKNNVFLEFN